MTWRRSFSAFPDGWPGHGLLLLRVTLGLPLICWGTADLLAGRLTAIPDLGAALAGIFVIGGLFTPLAGAIILVSQACIAFYPGFASSRPANESETWMHLMLAALGASVAMLGPGAWSADARRFGRRVFEVGQVRGPHA